jgi:predicted transcriptional regulator
MSKRVRSSVKGHARHEVDGPRFVYLPAVPRHAARRSALRHVMDTFFDGSPHRLVASLLGDARAVSEEDLDRIAELVARAKKDGRS